MSQIPTTSHRRRLAPPPPEPEPEPQPTVTVTVKRQLHPSPSTTTSTVYNLTNHFSRLNPNPNPNPNPPPQKSLNYPPPKLIDVHSQAKSLSKSAMLTPSNHKTVKKGKRVVLEGGKDVKKVVDSSRSHKEEEEVVVLSKSMSLSKSKSMSKLSYSSDVGVELSDFMVTNSAKLVAADMPPFIQIHAVGFARKIKDSLEKFTSKNLALSLKKEFDGVYGPAWHCIVGSSFGSFVTHSVGGFLYFSLDQKLYILLFKTNVQRLD